jgi:hypothetical protein
MRDCVRDKLCRPWTGRAIRDHFREVGYEVFEPCAFPWECKNFKEGFADAIPVTEPFDCSVRFWYRFKGDFFFAGIGRWPPPKEIEMADDIRGPCEAFRKIPDVEGLQVELRVNNDWRCSGTVMHPECPRRFFAFWPLEIESCLAHDKNGKEIGQHMPLSGQSSRGVL